MDDFDKIISRIKAKEELSTNQELAVLFGLTPQEFSRRKKRETLLPLLIEWGISRSEDLNWLLTGEGSPYAKKGDDLPVDNPPTAGNKAELQHMNLVKGFVDKQRAMNIDRELIELEKLDPETFKRVESYIKGTVDTVREVVKKNSPHCIERRLGQRRKAGYPDLMPDGLDRRSGMDRRMAVS